MHNESSSALKRRLQIVDLVRKDGEARVEDLSGQLGVSTVTIRSDLNYLEQQGYVVRAFGKARYNPMLLHGAQQSPESDAGTRGAGEAHVAAAALRWIEDGASLFLSSGNIAHRLLPQLVLRQGLSLSLHDLGMVTTARQFLQSEIHVTGGVHSKDEPGLIGPAAELGLLSHPLDMCVIVVCGIDTRGRVLARHPGAARLYSAAVRHANKTIALAYRPAFSATEGYPICNLGDLHGFAVNHDLEPAVFDLLSEHELRVDRKADGLIEFARA
ncbi:DeoR/GlpR family DNA-binding transcription regulator [Rhodoferax sp.]|uniref:DeoR/GlpR family DNA-binding transcription regulator n=1 Tax=Rhodoferax sp. TaxID=50421 RepID=UPI00374DE6A2